MTTIALEQARQHLETLGLKQAVEVLDNTLDAAASKQLTYADVLAQLLGAEVAVRKERYLTTKTRMAHLPFQRTLEQFDFAFQPSIDERQVKELANLAFVSEATNILLLAGIPQIKPTFLEIAPSGIPSNIIPHSKGVKCGLIRSNSPFSYSNHRPAKPKIPKPLVYAQVSPLGTSFATP